MAFARIALAGAQTYTRESAAGEFHNLYRLLWDWDASYPALPAAIMDGGANSLNVIEINKQGGAAYLEIYTNGRDFSAAFEDHGQIWLEYASHILHLPGLTAYGSNAPDRSDPYRWAADGGHIQALVESAPGSDDGSAVLTLWDGAGANPFDHDKLKLGERDIVRTYIGSRLRVREYIGAAQVN